MAGAVVLLAGVLPVVDFPAFHVAPAAPAVAQTPLTGQNATPDGTYTVPVKADVQTVGVTWPAGSQQTAESTAVAVRTRDAATGVWSSWTALDQEDGGPDLDSAEGRRARPGTEPLWVGSGKSAVQVKLQRTTSSAAVASAPVHLTTVADSGGPTVEQKPMALAKAATQPGIFNRGQWGAQAPSCPIDNARSVEAAVVHHTDGLNDYSPQQSWNLVRGIQAYHMQGQGWCDIGYNFLVDKYGQIFEGRDRSIPGASIGAHAGGFNTGTMGVAVMGDYSATQPSDPALLAVARVVAWKFAQYGVDPTGSVSLRAGVTDVPTQVPTGTWQTLPTIFGHRDVDQTACPGQLLYDRLGQIRGLVAAQRGPIVRGLMRQAWLDDGGPLGYLGPPRWDEGCASLGSGVFGCTQGFERGSAAWTTRLGAHLVKGAMEQAWWAHGGPFGYIGWPRWDEGCDSSGCTQGFERGSAAWSPGTGAHLVLGAMEQAWWRDGGPRGYVGYPRWDEGCSAVLGISYAGCTQGFERGTTTWNPIADQNGHLVKGAMEQAWWRSGGPKSRIGWPVQEEQWKGTTVTQRFERGTTSWSQGSGVGIG